MTIGAEVTLPGAGGRGYAALPPAPSRGVVVIHEILGPQPEIHRVVERFAPRGYAAIAPTLFESFLRPSCLRSAMQALRTGDGPYVEQLRVARAWLCERTGLEPEDVGLIGFCLGGGFALAAGSGWAAVSTNYGDVPSTEVLEGIGPVIGCYGGRDVLFRGNRKRLEERVRPLGIELETHTFPSVGHSFLTDGHHPVAQALSRPLMHIRYDAQIAEEAWCHIMAFFDRQLG